MCALKDVFLKLEINLIITEALNEFGLIVSPIPVTAITRFEALTFGACAINFFIYNLRSFGRELKNFSN